MHIYAMDLCWHMYRSYHTFGHFSATVNGIEKPTGHIFGVLSTIQSILTKEPDACIYLCEDGRPIGKTLNPEYKAGRQPLAYNIMQDRDLIERLACLDARVVVAYNENAEADQVMFTIAKRLARHGHYVTIFSGDDDLLQALGSTLIDITRGTDKKGGEIWIKQGDYLNPNGNLYSKYRGCPLECLPAYRALVGDHSDNLRGIERLPRDLAIILATNIDLSKETVDEEGLQNVLLKCNRSGIKYVDAVRSDWARLHINYVIMKLTECPLFRKEVNTSTAHEDIEALRLRKWGGFIESLKGGPRNVCSG